MHEQMECIKESIANPNRCFVETITSVVYFGVAKHIAYSQTQHKLKTRKMLYLVKEVMVKIK